MEIRKLGGYSWSHYNYDESNDTKIDFKTAKQLKKFLMGDTSIIIDGTVWKPIYFKVIKINKIKHTSIEAVIQKITLREYNLERLIG